MWTARRRQEQFRTEPPSIRAPCRLESSSIRLPVAMVIKIPYLTSFFVGLPLLWKPSLIERRGVADCPPTDPLLPPSEAPQALINLGGFRMTAERSKHLCLPLGRRAPGRPLLHTTKDAEPLSFHLHSGQAASRIRHSTDGSGQSHYCEEVKDPKERGDKSVEV